MREKQWWQWCRNGAVVAAVMTAAIQLAPSDLIAAREQMLQGLVGSYGAAQWTVTCTPTNSETKSSTAASDSQSLSTSKLTSATVVATVPGPTDGEEFAEARAVYSGTWTFEWNPVNSTDWPPDYTITSVHQRTFQARVKNGTGSSRARYTADPDLVTATLPNAGTSVDDGVPVSVQEDTTDPNLTIRTTTHSFTGKRGETGEMVDANGTVVTVERIYKAAWFQQNFTSPDDIILTFNVNEVDVTARADFDANDNTGMGSAAVVASDLFNGR